MIPEYYCFAPSVFAVADRYIICVALECEATVAVKIGDRCFYDASNGILRSKKYLHMVEVPMNVLDNEGKYTILTREFTDRKPYFPESNPEIQYEVSFKAPTKTEDIHISYISDTHGRVEVPSRSGAFFRDELDLLVLGGDIADHSGDINNFKTLFNIAGNITNGTVPCIFSRGNHDLRGQFAEVLADYTPTDRGCSYYTVKLGCMWFLVLDCGEDKEDACDEYGHTVACHSFRLAETEFIKDVAANAENEYLRENVKHKILLSHVPFAQRYHDPFNPEEEIYTEWCRLCKDNIKPQLWLCGHKHIAEILKVGCDKDNFGQPCDCVVGSKPDFAANTFVSAHIILSTEGRTVIFANENGEELSRTLL